MGLRDYHFFWCITGGSQTSNCYAIVVQSNIMDVLTQKDSMHRHWRLDNLQRPKPENVKQQKFI